MRLSLGAFLRYRPRALTVVVLVVVTAMLVLADFSFDLSWLGQCGHKSYGWPLIWERYVLVSLTVGSPRIVGWYYSAPRLIANLAIWLVMLVALAGACEWLLRRFRPRLRWSLRTMLAAVGLAAMFCSWFAAARNHANLQDRLIAAFKMSDRRGFLVERWGPKWLDLVGADRYRRHIVFAELKVDHESVEPLRQLGGLPKLRFLSVEYLTPALDDAMADALNGKSELRTLYIRQWVQLDDGDARLSEQCLAAIGKLTRLEYLDLYNRTIGPDRLAFLAGLTNLKSLGLWNLNDDDAGSSRECLAAIAKLPRLEDLRLEMTIDGEGLAYLARLKSLKSLRLARPTNDCEQISHQCLAAIGKLTQLEYLALRDMTIGGESLACLAGLSNLKSLSITQSADTDSAPPLKRLPPLPRLEVLNLDGSHVSDDDLRPVAALPRLKSLSLARTNVTAAGLANLAPLACLEELAIDGERVSQEGLGSLLALKGLKKLHLGDDAAHNKTGSGQIATLELDDGDVRVSRSEFAVLRVALNALRRAKPGIAIDDVISAILFQGIVWKDEEMMELDSGAAPGRYDPWDPWLPGPNVPWMNPTEKARFKNAGWWARFDAVGWGTDDKHTTSF